MTGIQDYQSVMNIIMKKVNDDCKNQKMNEKQKDCHWEISSQCNYSSVYLFNYKCAK